MFDEGGSRVMLRKVLVGAHARRILSVLPWLVLSGALFGQGNSGNAPGGGPANNAKRVPLSQDWTDHSVVFSNTGNPEKAFQLNQDPRYFKQWYGRSLAGSGKTPSKPGSAPTKPSGDWSVTEGNRTGGVAPIMYPAKFSFDVNATPNCTSDFAAFAINQPGLG